VFLNQFVDLTTLLDYISMCDIYVTPYMNEAQIDVRHVAYSFGLGKAVVSTPLLARTGTTGRRTRHSACVCEPRASARNRQDCSPTMCADGHVQQAYSAAVR